MGGALARTLRAMEERSGLYLTSDFVLEYTPHQRRFQLFAFADDEILTRDISAEHPEVARRLTHDYLATYETVDHLIHEKRILPVNRRDN